MTKTSSSLGTLPGAIDSLKTSSSLSIRFCILNITSIATFTIKTSEITRAIDVAIQYSKERVQFKRPICEFEGISFKVAEMITNFEAGKALLQKSLNHMEDGELAAMAKLFACTNAFKICDDAIQVLGGIGYTNKYPVERCARDVRLLRIGAGTDEIMKYIIQKGIYRKTESLEN